MVPRTIKRVKASRESGYLRDGRAPVPRRESTSRVMHANKAKNTGPELLLRSALQQLRTVDYSLNDAALPGRPDLAFPAPHLAVFVNGCFWHRCPHCRPNLPRSHQEFWRAKLGANELRDARKTRSLRRMGWSVMTLWECRIRADPVQAALRVHRRLANLASRPHPGSSVGSS
jgi:DNA mismatch endonuclease (patch repair protein)